jgi:hypothetical protein
MSKQAIEAIDLSHLAAVCGAADTTGGTGDLPVVRDRQATNGYSEATKLYKQACASGALIGIGCTGNPPQP